MGLYRERFVDKRRHLDAVYELGAYWRGRSFAAFDSYRYRPCNGFFYVHHTRGRIYRPDRIGD
jgi:hypothetical protein